MHVLRACVHVCVVPPPPSHYLLPSQVDKDKDGVVSLQEFLQYTGGKDFENNEEWKPIVDEPDQVSVVSLV